MAHVQLSAGAVEDIARLRITHRLPADTNERIRRSLLALARFPPLGASLDAGGWDGFRFLLGPWRWMVIVYEYLEDDDVVLIVTVQDARSSHAAPGAR